LKTGYIGEQRDKFWPSCWTFYLTSKIAFSSANDTTSYFYV